MSHAHPPEADARDPSCEGVACIGCAFLCAFPDVSSWHIGNNWSRSARCRKLVCVSTVRPDCVGDVTDLLNHSEVDLVVLVGLRNMPSVTHGFMRRKFCSPSLQAIPCERQSKIAVLHMTSRLSGRPHMYARPPRTTMGLLWCLRRRHSSRISAPSALFSLSWSSSDVPGMLFSIATTNATSYCSMLSWSSGRYFVSKSRSDAPGTISVSIL